MRTYSFSIHVDGNNLSSYIEVKAVNTLEAYGVALKMVEKSYLQGNKNQNFTLTYYGRVK